MTYLAITINQSHQFYDEIKGLVLHNFLSEKRLMIEYIELVRHENNLVKPHYHMLLISKNKMLYQELVKFKDKYGKLFYFEVIGNVLKYQKYMNNHDLKDKLVYGELPYVDEVDGDKLAYDVANGWSMKQLLLRHGMRALRNANNIKTAYEMININGYIPTDD